MSGMPSLHSADLAASKGALRHTFVIFQRVLLNHTHVGEAEHRGSFETNVLDHCFKRYRQITARALNLGGDRVQQPALDRWLLT
jgi:hypothetical protein